MMPELDLAAAEGTRRTRGLGEKSRSRGWNDTDKMTRYAVAGRWTGLPLLLFRHYIGDGP